MASRILPRHLIPASIISMVVLGFLLALFFGQFRWLADSIVSASLERYDENAHAVFQTQAGAHMDQLATQVGTLDPPTAESLQRMLETGNPEDAPLIGLRLELPGGERITAGSIADEPGDSPASWTSPRWYVSRRVLDGQRDVGSLTGIFDLSRLQAARRGFRAGLLEKEWQRLRLSYTWIGAGTVLAVALCLGAVWLVVRTQNARIRELKLQAEKLSQADFGEHLDITGGDELGQLADVFNAMRDKLRRTTISRNYLDSVLANMNEAIIITSADGTITRVNRATSQMLGFSETELVGRSIDSLVDGKQGSTLEIGSRSSVPREAMLVAKSGKAIPVSYTGSVIRADDVPDADRIFAAQNITERRKAEQRIRYLARIDALTKVPNRMQFQHLLQRAIARASRARNALGLLYIDIDHFKEINDTFGHLAGDTTLETVAERLIRALPADTIIGRLAGDEFAVIVDHLQPGADLRSNLDKITHTLLARLADPFSVQGHEVFMTASIGVAMYPADAANVIDLIRNADAALYHAKKNGGNAYYYYVPEMNEAAVERLMTKSKLKRAFERNELLVHYQPKYNIETGEIVGAEALVRWELPERGIILPSDFIPIAEETNLIIEIGEWVLDRVCEDFRYWQRSVGSPGRVSVNLSLKQLRQPNFINRISSILRSYEVSPTSLELEITETTLMENPPRTIKLLDELYALGLNLAIDDFGTGYSSLSALQQFPITTLKIDKSFVRDIAVDADDATIVGTIIHMGKSLNMDVVAEGVETEEQLNFLQTLHCTYVQGLLFGDPMSSDNYLELMLAQAEGTGSHRALFA